MKDIKAVFIDTAPFFYFFDNNPQYADKTQEIFLKLYQLDIPMVSSSITCIEYLTNPYRVGEEERIHKFYRFIQDTGIQILAINTAIADRGARIRAKYPAIKTMDALQLAAAVESVCELFLTNDRQLRQVSEIRVVTLDEWKEKLFFEKFSFLMPKNQASAPLLRCEGLFFMREIFRVGDAGRRPPGFFSPRLTSRLGRGESLVRCRLSRPVLMGREFRH